MDKNRQILLGVTAIIVSVFLVIFLIRYQYPGSKDDEAADAQRSDEGVPSIQIQSRQARISTGRSDALDSAAFTTYPPPEPNAQYKRSVAARISGQITDPRGEPITGAVVSLVQQNTTPYPLPLDQAFESASEKSPGVNGAERRPRHVLSGEDGGFEISPIEYLQAAEIAVLSEAEGYVPQVSAIQELDRLTTSAEVSIEMEPGYSLLVQVTDRNEIPISDAAVSVICQTPNQWRLPCGTISGKTDAAGECRFHQLMPEICAVKVNAPNHQTIMRRLSYRDKRSQQVAFKLHPGEAIAGRVIDDQGNPVSGVDIHLQAQGQVPQQGVREWDAVSDENGEWRIDGLPDRQEFLLSATYAPGADVFHIKRNYRRFMYSLQAPNENVEIVLTGNATIEARLVDSETDRPLPEVRVSIKPSGSTDVRESTILVLNSERVETDNGAISIAGIPSGLYLITLDAAGFMRREYGPVKVESPETLDLGDVPLEHGNGISGVVLSQQTMEPLSGVRVVLKGEGTNRRETTDDAGHFSFLKLDPGSYSIIANSQDYLPFERSGIEFPGGTLTEIEPVYLDAGRRISGTVVDSQGKPEAQIKVQAIQMEGTGGDVKYAYSDEEGRFSFQGLRPAPYQVFCEKKIADHSVFSLEQVDLTLQSSQEITLELKQTANLQLQVDSAAGLELNSIRVEGFLLGQAGPQRPFRAFQMTSDRETFAVPYLSPGPYLLKVDASDSTGGRYRLFEVVQLVDGENPMTLNIVNRTLSGQVWDQESDSAMPKAEIIFQQQLPDPRLTQQLSWALSHRSIADDKGRYSMEGLQNAEYQVVVRPPGQRQIVEIGTIDLSDPATRGQLDLTVK